MAELLTDGLSQLNITLPPAIIQKELTFLDELLRWNQRINLTSIKGRDAAIEKHLIDSLILLPYLHKSKRMLDLGSGGGLPGIALAIAEPFLQVVSVDSVGKKTNFQKHMKRLLQLDNLVIIQSRAEALDRSTLEQESFDLVVARAFTSLEAILSYASPWIKPGGRVIAMKGPEGESELGSAESAIRQNNFTQTTICPYKLPFSHAERQLLILKK